MDLRLILAIVIASLLSGCGNSDWINDGLDDSVEQVENTLDFVEDLIITGPAYIISDDTTITFFENGEPDLYIRSNRSTITITSGSKFGDVYIEGNNSIITFEYPISLNSLNFEGSDNVVNIPSASGITISSDTGLGNILIQY